MSDIVNFVFLNRFIMYICIFLVLVYDDNKLCYVNLKFIYFMELGNKIIFK